MPSRRSADSIEAFAPYAEQLRALPFVRRVDPRAVNGMRGERQLDLVADIRLSDGTRQRRCVEVKSSHLDRSAAHHVRALFGDDPDEWLLAAPHIGAPLGDALEAEGVQFIDLAGNCHLRFGDAYLARVQGRSPAKPPARSKSLRSAGYQVLFALLVRPELVEGTQREVADAAGTSRQPVIDLFERLVEERILVRRGRRHEWVEERPPALLDRWLAGYRSHVRPRLDEGRYRLAAETPEALEAHLDAHLGESVRYGGTAAAHRLVGHYRGPLTVAYLGAPTAKLLRALRARPTREPERSGDLLWMRPFGTASVEGATEDTVHPLLVYAELMSDPDPRAGESARRLRERYLAWSF